jgi:hypothetical protein
VLPPWEAHEATRIHRFARWAGDVAASGSRAASGEPVVGFINPAFAHGYTPQMAAVLKGLGETGYVEGRNVAIKDDSMP